jgi:hypothetical protein
LVADGGGHHGRGVELAACFGIEAVVVVDGDGGGVNDDVYEMVLDSLLRS